MPIQLHETGKITALILISIVTVAVIYSVIAISNKPPQMAFPVAEGYQFPYDFGQEQIWGVTLPPTLNEISGIASINPEQVMAIQDEKGIIYTVELETGNIVSEMPFDKDRDYEDICQVGDSLFIIERDGDLYSFHLSMQDSVHKFETAFSYRNDVESLGFDPITQSLLIAPKEGAPDGGIAEKRVQGIYQYDLNKHEIDLKPWISVSEMELGRILDRGSKPYKFKPSAVAVHPVSGHIYLLSSIGKILIVLDRKGAILHVQKLDETLLPQPEGLAFDSQNSLLISSEAAGGVPSIIRLPYLEPK